MAQRKELLGYTVPMVAKPGETVQIMVTTEGESYDAEIVRLIHGDNNPDGPGFKSERIESDANGTYPGRHQHTEADQRCEVSEYDERQGLLGGVPALGAAGLHTEDQQRRRQDEEDRRCGRPDSEALVCKDMPRSDEAASADPAVSTRAVGGITFSSASAAGCSSE